MSKSKSYLYSGAIIDEDSGKIIVVRYNEKWVLPGDRKNLLRGPENLAGRIRSGLPGISIQLMEKQIITIESVTDKARITNDIQLFSLLENPGSCDPESRTNSWALSSGTERELNFSNHMRDVFSRLRQEGYLPQAQDYISR